MHAHAPVPAILVGRERERALLEERLAAALAGQGGVVLIGGEAGIGKTALAEVLCREATERGALVLVGRCYDLTETPPYGPWVEALARSPAGDALPTLPTAVLAPERGGDALTGQDAILRRVRDYLAALAALRPVVLLIDDLHWADPASLDLLRVVARGLADVPLLLLATYRAEEVGRGHSLAALLPLLVREADAARLDLRPLDAAAIDALVAAHYALDHADHHRLVPYLAGRTEGNALFLGELLRTLEAEGVLHATADRWALGDLEGIPIPTLLRQVIEGRLRRLAPETERLLAVAAVIGQEVPLALWAAVGEVGEGPLLDHSDRATAARLVTETPDGAGMRFAHALIREALYAGMSPARRRAWHRRAGEAMLAMPRPDPDAVAHHFERAGDPRAFAWLVRAGLRARHASAWLTAAARFMAAAALPDEDGARAGARGWLLFYGATRLIFADHAQGLRALDVAEPLAVAAGDRALAAYIRLHRSQHLFNVGEIRRALAEMDRGVAELDVLPDAVRLRAGEDVALEQIVALLPDGERAVTVPIPARTAPPVGLYGAYAAHWRTQSGRYREGLALCEAFIAALAPARDDDRLLWGAPAQLGLGHAHAALGRPEAARRAYALCRDAYHAMNNAYMVAITFWCEIVYAVVPYHADDPAERTRLVAEAAHAWGRARGTITHTLHDDPTDLFPALVEGRWADADRLARAHEARFLLTSTSEAYGDPQEHPQVETYRGNVNPVGERSCYDESKRFAESLTMEYHRTYGADIRIVRLFNTYGPRMDIKDGRVIPNLLSQALSGKPLTLYDGGERTRAFCYVDDLVRGLLAVMESSEAQGEVINLGNPDERTIRSLAAVILAVTGRDLPTVERPTAVGDDPNRRCPDIAKARALTGWSPTIPLDEGLRRTIPYFEQALRSITGTSEHAAMPGHGPTSRCRARVAA